MAGRDRHESGGMINERGSSMNTPMNIDELVQILQKANDALLQGAYEVMRALGDVREEEDIESLRTRAEQAALNYQQKCRDVAELESKLAESQRKEWAHEAAIKRHYDDATCQCFLCYSCVNHDARSGAKWDGKKLEGYACSGCGKSHPKWRFDEGRFAQEGTK